MTTTTTTTPAPALARDELLAEYAKASREVADAARAVARRGRYPVDGLTDEDLLRGVLRLRDAVGSATVPAQRRRGGVALPSQRRRSG